VRHHGAAIQGHTTDDDGNPTGELDDRRRAVGTDIEHGVMRFDVRVGETDRGARGPADEVSTGPQPDRRTDGRAGHLDDGPQNSNRGRIGRACAVTAGDHTPGPDAGPRQRHRGVDHHAVDRHAGCRVEAGDPSQLTHRRRVRVGPQFVGGSPRSGHDEARWSIEMHNDLWVERAR
jgi:hypothetical protein